MYAGCNYESTDEVINCLNGQLHELAEKGLSEDELAITKKVDKERYV